MGGRNAFKLEFPGIPENVEFARVTVACFASQLGGFTLEELDDIRLVTSEAVSNAIIHGYHEHAGPVYISGSICDGALEVIVEDKGRGIEDIEKARQPAYTTSPDRLGMGLTIIEALVDELIILSEPGNGTRLIMRKQPAHEAHDGSHAKRCGEGSGKAYEF
ncbi:MAG: anti-sigma F factor [Firmicutes bacterium]|nr:anti-sigma F factor [Bacillota bacterium]